MGNTITADLNGRTSCITDSLWQYDYGQILKISGVELPDSYEVHFSDKRLGISTAMLGDDEGVQIPDMYLLSGRDVTAWVYLHTTDEDGETEYDITIPVKERAKPTYDEPTPVQQAFIEQAIAAMNAAVEKTDGNVEKYPRIIEGYWCVWDADEEQFVSTGVKAQGEPGFSPIANVTKTGNTATITITDESGTTTAQVHDGDYENLIDDTAGAGVTDKAWSADKNVTMLAGKADKTDTVLETTLSRGRQEGSTVGTGSFAFGNNVIASGNYSFAGGVGVTASGNYAHAEGQWVPPRTPGGTGIRLIASGSASHAEGIGTKATGSADHAEGNGSEASGSYSHAEGTSTASGQYSHAENASTASGLYSHAEGLGTTASGQHSHSEGNNTVANHQSQHAGGEYNVPDPSTAQATARGTYVEIIGNGTASNNKSNARTLDWSGNERLKGDLYVNCNVDSTGGTAVGETLGNKADKANTVLTTTLSRGRMNGSTVGTGSVAFGQDVIASGSYSHAFGKFGQYESGGSGQLQAIMASGECAGAEGCGTTASGKASHAEGYWTTANHYAQHASGEFNVDDPSSAESTERGNYVEIIGNGTSPSAKSNARTLDWDGNERLKGDLYVGCNADSSGGSKVISEATVATTTETQAIIDEWGESA